MGTAQHSGTVLGAAWGSIHTMQLGGHSCCNDQFCGPAHGVCCAMLCYAGMGLRFTAALSHAYVHDGLSFFDCRLPVG
jgi:hypothetical protein